ncbi:nucleic acid/nucleotide deaminase domain-containing protein [Cellulomonas flavigena]|uniref:nucleic acid/nucleotide deaminase domain-containing protein n=1 Tax=Cellulomonas flavigena TaxID=1711 RepID=UPI0011D203F0|nr:nucleic acid/nucleotide deaminase domain-containing protein [Cellulomonas flavigena]
MGTRTPASVQPPPGRASLPHLQRLVGNRAVAAALLRRTGAGAPVVQRAAGLPFDSHTEIHHNLLTSREFQLSSGEGVIVELRPEWFLEDDTEDKEDRVPVPHSGPEAPPGLGGEVRVDLENLEWLDESKGRCAAAVGRWNEIPLRTDEDGAHQLSFEIDDHHHHYYVDGPVHVRQGDAAELTDSCAAPASRSGKDVLHDVLALAGMIPVLGVLADAADTAIYVIDGDWTGAGISAAAMVPVLGDAASLARIGGRTVVRVTRAGAKQIEKRTAAELLKETRAALTRLRTPPGLAHAGNRLGQSVDPRLLEMAKEARVTQAGISREAFASYNVATARVRVGTEIRYLDAGNSPGRLMHSEDWLITQVEELRRVHGRESVALEQLFSERIPCGECLPKLERLFNAEVFYAVAKRGTRATDLMKAYGLR